MRRAKKGAIDGDSVDTADAIAEAVAKVDAETAAAAAATAELVSGDEDDIEEKGDDVSEGEFANLRSSLQEFKELAS